MEGMLKMRGLMCKTDSLLQLRPPHCEVRDERSTADNGVRRHTEVRSRLREMWYESSRPSLSCAMSQRNARPLTSCYTIPLSVHFLRPSILA